MACGAFAMFAADARFQAVRSERAEQLAVWSTAVQYHALHALALLAFGVWRERSPGGGLAGFLFLAGIALFSGSLYALALGGPSWLGPVTPLGGLAFLAGWAALGFQALRR
jgi:uncharacterized membrane protein YgdD (TMEM256/DUF423 family)